MGLGQIETFLAFEFKTVILPFHRSMAVGANSPIGLIATSTITSRRREAAALTIPGENAFAGNGNAIIHHLQIPGHSVPDPKSRWPTALDMENGPHGRNGALAQKAATSA